MSTVIFSSIVDKLSRLANSLPYSYLEYHVLQLDDNSHPDQPKKVVIKRIVALEGDVVQTRSPYPETHVRVPRGHCWVEGDELFHSKDSNHYGPVPLGLVRSKVEYVLYPLNRFGKIPDKSRGNRVRYAPGHKVYNRLDHD
ncbi:hypothetical protein BGZ96_011785 [Linnemannia gamsii]|uniref:Mitochondrial inner membrane protease subunit 2 n=1 Tax=Linnemannia gamsii TaxID=64522 RepID=A0ABQ7KCA5_9FUNG|nr:hypothetical protein BGZ96_011785 [Linnemannia gamsii]